jgi:propionate CoA-transferase
MDAAIFRVERMGLREDPVLSLAERLSYHAGYQGGEDLLYMNFEGLRLDSEQDAADLAEQLEAALKSYGRKVSAVVNYDNFSLAPAAADRYWTMIRHNTEHYISSLTRYSTNAFFRHQLGERFAAARLDGRIYRSFDEATHHLNGD